MRLYQYRILDSNPYLLADATAWPNIRAVGFDELWPDYTGRDIVIAVIDSGCDTAHPDLKDNIIAGYSFVPLQRVSNVNDENGHGTHVAGIIAAHGRLRGGAYGAKLLILKVFDASGQCSVQRVVDAVNYAVSWRGPQNERVSIINMSLGGSADEKNLRLAVERATAKGILVVCAAGNSGDGLLETTEIDYPAAYSATLSVGAVDLQLRIAYFTNTNDWVDVSAPGAEIVSTFPGNRYVQLSGTSMAAPHVTAFAACIMERFYRRNLRYPTPEKLKSIIRMLAVDIGSAGICRATGAGFVTFLPQRILHDKVASVNIAEVGL